MNLPTLVLDAYMTPHAIRSWQDVIVELFTGKVEILSEYDEIIYHNEERGLTMRMPAVARLLKPTSRYKKGIKFSTINVHLRDEFRCQYCGGKFKLSDLNKDHVLPRAKGGKTVWENIVSACYKCNSDKGNRTPEQAKMKLLRAPVKPKTLPIGTPVIAMRTIPEEWKPFLPMTA
jgi:5-methylcytosine-specific restriction endonuclease McrA